MNSYIKANKEITDPLKDDVHKKMERVIFILFIALVILFLTRLIDHELHQLFISKNHLAMHTAIEFFAISVSLFIAIQGWLIFPYKMSRRRLLFSVLFLTVGLFDLMHTISYEGIPFFITENSINKTTWFWISARISEAIGILLITLMDDYKLIKDLRRRYFSLALIFIAVISSLIFIFEQSLPILLTSDSGPTKLKIGIIHSISLLLFINILTIIYKSRKSKESINISLILSLGFLLISDLIFTLHHYLSDFDVMLGHIYKIIGFYFLLKAIYVKSIEEPFIQKEEANKELFKYQQQIGWMIEHIPGGFLAIDTDLKVTIANKTAQKLLGDSYDDGNVIGKNIVEISKYKEINEDEIRIIKALKYGSIFIKEKIKHNNSKVVQADVSPIIDPTNGEILGALSYFFEITEEEHENKKKDKLISYYFQQSKNLQHLIDSIPIAFLAIDSDAKIIALNDKTLYIPLFSDYTKADLIGKHISEFAGKNDMQLENTLIYRALKGEKIQNVNDIILNNNYLVNAYPIIGIEGDSIIGAISFYQDTTELEILRDRIGNMERLSLVGQMAASITHEIRNPMASVRGFIQLLNEQTGGESHRYYEIIIDELDRANSIISDFLSLSQTRVLEMDNNNLNDIINELYPILMADANIKGQIIELKLADSLPNLYLNTKEIKQLLLNLALNGMEAMEQGGILTISTKEVSGSIELRIADIGNGISEDKMAKLFEPFYTTKERGTGLGLTVSMSIVEKHNGKMVVESKEGIGTEFIISFVHM